MPSHHLALERRIDLGAGQDDRGRAERLRDLGPGAGSAHLHPLVVGKRGHTLVTVHEHLGRRGTARNGGDVELVQAPFHQQVGTAATEHPVDHLLVFHGAGEAAEQHAGPVDAPVVAGPVMADLRDALAHGFGHFERLPERAAREHLDLDLTVCEELDLLGDALGVVLEQRPAAPRRGHAPLLCARRQAGTRRARRPALRLRRLSICFSFWLPHCVGAGRVSRAPNARKRRVSTPRIAAAVRPRALRVVKSRRKCARPNKFTRGPAGGSPPRGRQGFRRGRPNTATPSAAAAAANFRSSVASGRLRRKATSR